MMTKQQLLEKATTFMVREFGVPANMVSGECRDRWHERLGLLAQFIDDIAEPDKPEPKCNGCSAGPAPGSMWINEWCPVHGLHRPMVLHYVD